MVLRFHLFPSPIPLKPRKFQSHPFPSTTHLTPKPKPHKISCAKTPKIDDLASDLAIELEKLGTRLVQKEEAMKKSREILFTELCKYLGLRSEELEKKWKELEEEDKWVLVKGFVSEWGVDFHPLSARSVKELVEEHMVEDNPNPSESSQSVLFPALKKILGFPPIT